jgi:hypothetical protein
LPVVEDFDPVFSMPPVRYDGGMTKPAASSASPTKLALSRKEAAQALGVSAVTIDRLTKRGFLHPSRATRRPIYPVKELERFLRETSPNDYQAPTDHFAGPGRQAESSNVGEAV